MKHKLFAVLALVFLFTLNSLLSTLHAQDAVFTYQGRIQDSGTNFNGTGQFKFALVISTNNHHQATATANLSGNFVTSYTVTAGGNGYSGAPAVTVSGGGGSGATATANVGGGVVTGITPGSAGSGYTSPPTVIIAPPPANISYTTYWSNDGTSSAGSEPSAAVNVSVNNGLFTVPLGDTTLANMTTISASLFAQPNLQLRIWFNDGVNGFAALSPVQNLTPAPYAISSATAATVTGNVSAGQITGTLPLAQLPASIITNGASGVNISGTLNGNGGSLTNLNLLNLVGPLTVAAPVSLGHIYDGGQALGVAVSGNFAYLANNADGLRVYNIANPTNPVSIGHIADGGNAFSVAVLGNFAYLANGGDGLRVYNIANPTNPVSIGHIDDGGAAVGVAVSGNFAYLANQGDGLRVYNVANPTNPVSIGHIYDGGQALGVAVSGNFAYLANYDDELRVYAIANPANPVSIGHIYDGAFARGVAVSGNFAYLANQGDGLRVYNIANPTNPVSIGHIYDGGQALGVAVSGNFAYLANQGDGLRVYNITSPTNPVSIGHIDDGGTASGVAVSGNFAYLANDTDGLRVYGLLSGVALVGGGNAFTGNQTVTGGNVGIGTTTPSGSLHIVTGGAQQLYIERTGAITGKYRLGIAGANHNFYIQDEIAGAARLIIDSGGSVGIGRTPTVNRFEVEGEASKATASGWFANSDARIKQDIQPIHDALDMLAKVRTVSFRYTDDYREQHQSVADRRYLNVVAQEFRTVFPDAVKSSGEKLPDGSEILQVDTYPLTIYSAAAIQELNQKLTDELKRQDTENAELKARLERLERLVNQKNGSAK